MSVYFLRYGNLIKIGYSGSLGHRVRSIMSGVPGHVEFVGHMPGDRELEAHFHQMFADSRFNGEWFVSTEPLEQLMAAALIKELPSIDLTVSVHGRRLDASDAWATDSARLRSYAARRWPGHPHKGRIVELARVLGWRHRRVRSLYHNEPGLTLRTVETDDLSRLFKALPAKTSNPSLWEHGQ